MSSRTLIGQTAVIEIKKLNPYPKVKVLAKLESQNPTGSVKDRAADYLVQDAEDRGLLTEKKTLLEATSGNMGVALARLACLKGYRFAAVMPEGGSQEKRELIRAHGAEIILDKQGETTEDAIQLAKKLAAENQNYLWLNQFDNPANVQAHYETTGPEIINQVPDLDVFVAGIGTGGTLMGVGRRLKEYRRRIKIIGLEPARDSPIEGLRNLNLGLVPKIYNERWLDEKIIVREADALKVQRELFFKEGLSVGVSSGAALWGGLRIAAQLKKGKIVVLFPDRGDRY